MTEEDKALSIVVCGNCGKKWGWSGPDGSWDVENDISRRDGERRAWVCSCDWMVPSWGVPENEGQSAEEIAKSEIAGHHAEAAVPWTDDDDDEAFLEERSALRDAAWEAALKALEGAAPEAVWAIAGGLGINRAVKLGGGLVWAHREHLLAWI